MNTTPARAHDSATVRAHLHYLRASGVTVSEVAARTGYATKYLYTFLSNNPPARVSTDLERAVLAVRAPKAARTRNLVRVDPHGTVARVRALMCLGWTVSDIAARAHMQRETLRRIERGITTPSALTRARIIAVYDELWNRQPARTPQRARTRALARAHGWTPPMGLDDDTLDLPRAHARAV